MVSANQHAMPRDPGLIRARRSGVVLTLLLLTLVAGCGRRQEEPAPTETANSQPSSKPPPPNRREIWLARAIEATTSIKDPEARSTAARFASLALTNAGNHQQAFQLVEKFVLADRKDSVLGILAQVQSSKGGLERAMTTVSAISTEKERDSALLGVATGQIQCGQTDQAINLIRRIKDPYCKDYVRGSVATAQAEAGDMQAARTTAAKISDADQLQRANKAIAKGKVEAPTKDTGSGNYVRSHLRALLQFSQGGGWHKHAYAALTAAGQKNDKELDIQIAKTLEAMKNAKEPEPPMGRLFLCVALMGANRLDESRTMAGAFQKDADGEILGISGLFGKPVLAYLFTRLGMEDELKKLLKTKPGGFVNNGVMQAIGVAEAEAGNFDGAEMRFKKLSSPSDRADFACGVLQGLAK